MSTTKNLLVPHDFTAAGDAAVDYALNVAKKLDAEVNLVHIVKEKKEQLSAEKKFESIVADLNLKSTDPKVNTNVVTGDIFTNIATTAKELHSSLIIMGTHGAKGMQKVFGSFAIKVITSTHVPFVVVQKDYKYNEPKDIVVPIDTSKESLQIEQVVSAIASKVNSKVHVIHEKYSDTSLKIKSSVHFEVIAKQFQSNHIPYEKGVIPKLNAKEIVKYAKSINSDLIAIAYHSESLISQLDRIFQDLITNNSQIPVLMINSKDAGNYFF